MQSSAIPRPQLQQIIFLREKLNLWSRPRPREKGAIMLMKDMDRKEVLEARVREDRTDLVHLEVLDAISRLESLEVTTRSVQEVPQVLRIVKVKVVDREPETQRLASVTRSGVCLEVLDPVPKDNRLHRLEGDPSPLNGNALTL